ncbi:hypothetical protein V6N11_015782 [Hibiscus sabdariffa]|uniref:Uncharacterized protein n=1 Tax=Hibiscus sabdariffa TaxID=183260 RepID=A0ABR2TTN8_9ROSI
MQSRSVQLHSSIKGKETLSTPNTANADPFMEREEVEEISKSKMDEIIQIENGEIKDLVDPLSLPNLSKIGYEPKPVNSEYTAIFSKGDTNMILSCNVENLNLENINISDSTQEVQVIGSRKRKALADISDEDLFSANKRREVLEADAMLVDQAVPLGCRCPGVFKLESLMDRCLCGWFSCDVPPLVPHFGFVLVLGWMYCWGHW